MLKRFLPLVVFLTACVSLSAAGHVTPEMFGAVGDGIHDDAPAFSKCIRSGMAISLLEGRRYAFHSRISWIDSNSFELQGNGATIILSKDYPLKEYDQIFGFSDHDVQRNSFIINNLRIECRFAQKFPDKNRPGDTYIICLGRCGRAQVSGVVFEDLGQYNNVSFIVNTGANLVLRDCVIKSHSNSKQGGALWVMNKYLDRMNLKISGVNIDYGTQDECFCISFDPRSSLPGCRIKARVSDCVFSGPGSVQSSGFFIEHSNTDTAESHFDARFTSCTFRSVGTYPHRIVFYQSGKVPGNSFRTVYKDCDFVFRPRVHSEVGLISMPPKDRGVYKKNIFTEFKGCRFDISNVSSLIGDKDGETTGTCSFTNCSISTDGELFVRRYNPGAGDVDIRTKNGAMTFAGDHITTESLDAKGTVFRSSRSYGVKVWKEGLSREPLPVKTRRCTIEGNKNK